MGNIDIKIDLRKEDLVQQALRDGLREGLEESGNWMLDEGEDKAKDAIIGAGRIWRRSLKEGFHTEENEFSRTSRWNGQIRNEAPHARIVQNGLKPGNSPSVQDILPWVDDKLTPNERARVKAENTDLSDWESDELIALAERYGKPTLITAFAVKGKLENKGYPGIDFLEIAETYLEQISRAVVKQKIEKKMNQHLRAAGLQ